MVKKDAQLRRAFYLEHSSLGPSRGLSDNAQVSFDTDVGFDLLNGPPGGLSNCFDEQAFADPELNTLISRGKLVEAEVNGHQEVVGGQHHHRPKVVGQDLDCFQSSTGSLYCLESYTVIQ